MTYFENLIDDDHRAIFNPTTKQMYAETQNLIGIDTLRFTRTSMCALFNQTDQVMVAVNKRNKG